MNRSGDLCSDDNNLSATSKSDVFFGTIVISSPNMMLVAN